MDLYFAGAEQPGWRTLLHREGVRHVSLSWYGLKRRKNPRDFLIRDNFDSDTRVFLDSGAYSVNKDSETSQDDAYELAQEYMDFVDANIDSIAFASEFDAMVLGKDLLWDIRRQYWQNLPGDKWMPVWHSEWGSQELSLMAGEYARVGVLQSDGKAQDIKSRLRSLASTTKFHGVSMTKIELMKELPLDSVGSTSWLSTTQFGDTFIWDGRELHRYPKDYKFKRQSHRAWLQQNGFDTVLIENDESTDPDVKRAANAELLRLSIWSWRHFTDSIQSRGVTTSVLDPFGENQETPPTGVDTLDPSPGNGVALRRREKVLLPVLRTETETTYEPDGTESQRQVLRSSRGSLLQCNTCHMASNCPMMVPDNECAYEIPVEIRTSAQLAALQDTLIEMQVKRVARMTMIEESEGGYSDSNTSAEYDRLQRMIKNKLENGKERAPLIQMSVGGGGGPGMISRIFGEATATRVAELPAPIDSSDIIDAVVIDA